MSSIEEKIGYLTKSVESLADAVNLNTLKSDKLCGRIEKIEEQISLYKNFIKFSKLIVATVMAILALKFGDVKAIWR